MVFYAPELVEKGIFEKLLLCDLNHFLSYD